MNRFKKIFYKKNPVIGMIHLTPLLGHAGFKDIDSVLSKVKSDLIALEHGGIDAILIENNYDLPHVAIVSPGTVSAMTYVVERLIKMTNLPIGVCVLWNDYEAALSIAKIAGAQFVRVPVFVDNVRTSYGEIEGNYKRVLEIKKRLKAEKILLFTDIHVKHAKILNNDTIEESALKAIMFGSDALIITGKWTADAPLLKDLKSVRQKVRSFPIFVGSGATCENVAALLAYSNGIIVGTALKTGTKEKGNVNIKSYKENVSVGKVKMFMRASKKL